MYAKVEEFRYRPLEVIEYFVIKFSLFVQSVYQSFQLFSFMLQIISNMDETHAHINEQQHNNNSKMFIMKLTSSTLVRRLAFGCTHHQALTSSKAISMEANKSTIMSIQAHSTTLNSILFKEDT